MSDLSRRLSSITGFGRVADRPIIISFGSWLPDLPALSNPGALEAKNVIPAAQSYRPFPGLLTQSDALNGRVLGAFAAKDNSGNAYHYAGTSNKLYEVRNMTATDKSGTAYSTASDDVWESAQFGSDVIFTNYTDPVQSLTAGGGGNFADHIASTLKPKARHVASVGNFLVLGNTVDGTDGTKTSRVWWSAIGDSTDYDPDSGTQCDFEDLKDGGQVQRIVGGADYGVIFQETAIRRMAYTGGAAIFDLNPMDRRRGTPIPNSVIGHGRRVFYISEEGVFVFTGTESVPIGANRFDRWFWDQFDVANAHFVSAGIDPENKLIAWSFPGEGSSGTPNRILLYNWEVDRAAYVELEVELIVSALTQAFTLEDLDTINTSIDALTVSLDNAQWQGGAVRFASYTTDHKLAYFTGDNLAATLDTGEFQAQRGGRALIDFARPLVDGGTVTVAAGGRELQTDAVSFDAAVSPNSDDGLCSVDNASRYHRMRVEIAASGSWTHAQGVQIHARPLGQF